MGIIRKTFIIACAACGMAVTSQAPEFSQQYRQRLAGAVEELRVVSEDFARDAAASSMSTREALLSMRGSNDAFSRDRSVSMEKTINRFEKLRGQRIAMEKVPGFLRPLNVLDRPDNKILNDAWQDFEPAVPLTFAGLLWGGFGALFAGLFGWLFSAFGRKQKTAYAAAGTKKGVPPDLDIAQFDPDSRTLRS